MKIHQSLGYFLNTSARCIKRKLEIQLKNHDITTAQWAIMKRLPLDNNLSQAEVVEKPIQIGQPALAIVDEVTPLAEEVNCLVIGIKYNRNVRLTEQAGLKAILLP